MSATYIGSLAAGTEYDATKIARDFLIKTEALENFNKLQDLGRAIPWSDLEFVGKGGGAGDDI